MESGVLPQSAVSDCPLAAVRKLQSVVSRGYKPCSSINGLSMYLCDTDCICDHSLAAKLHDWRRRALAALHASCKVRVTASLTQSLRHGNKYVNYDTEGARGAAAMRAAWVSGAGRFVAQRAHAAAFQ